MSTTTAAPDAIDDTVLTAFEDRLIRTFNAAAVNLMLSIGHRTGLLDTLARTGPTTSQGLATAAGLKERYVREWLGAMVTGDIVRIDPEGPSYWLPAEHAQLLSSDGIADLSSVAMWVPMLSTVEDDIVRCFRDGGGVGYEAFTRFHEVMEAESAQTTVAAIDDAILPLVPGLTDHLMDGIDVLDVGCGRGRTLNHLAQRFPASRFVGVDLSGDAVAYATAYAAERGLTNVRFEVADAARLTDVIDPDTIDLVTTFDAIHDQADPAAVLAGIEQVLRPEGVYLAQDIDGSSHHHGDTTHPLGPLLYTVSCLHCMSVSLAQDGAGLGAMWGRETAHAMFADAGFTDVSAHTLEHDIQNVYYVCTR